MKIPTLSLLAGGAAVLIAAVPMAAVNAQSAMAVTVAADHGDYTLKQREEWLHNRLDKSRDDGSLDRGEYERVNHELGDIRSDEDGMRDHHDGQLTGNETATLEARLDGVADKIHWLHESSFRKPW